jgi:hypothetical protein
MIIPNHHRFSLTKQLIFVFLKEDENNDDYYTTLSVCADATTLKLFTIDGDKCPLRVAIGRFRNEINQTG